MKTYLSVSVIVYFIYCGYVQKQLLTYLFLICNLVHLLDAFTDEFVALFIKCEFIDCVNIISEDFKLIYFYH